MVGNRYSNQIDVFPIQQGSIIAKCIWNASLMCESLGLGLRGTRHRHHFPIGDHAIRGRVQIADKTRANQTYSDSLHTHALPDERTSRWRRITAYSPDRQRMATIASTRNYIDTATGMSPSEA